MNTNDKIYLLNLARSEIAKKIKINWNGYKGLNLPTATPEIKEVKGTFVTLTIAEELRGCIGQIIPNEPVEETIKENAVSAAFYDPRFSPLSQDEFKEISVEISILSRPEPLKYNGAEDLLKKLEPTKHGLIIRSGGRSATFLPQVWEDLPKKEDFLSHLCMKAGLFGDDWKKGQMEVHTYTVEHFDEKELGLKL